MGEGLTRRRAGAGPTSPVIGSDPDQPQSSNNTTNNNNNNSSSSSKPSSSTTGAGGGKVAYDPRDFQDDAESNKMPRLTLMEEVLLLGLKDKAVRLYLLYIQHDFHHQSGLKLSSIVVCVEDEADVYILGLPIILE